MMRIDGTWYRTIWLEADAVRVIDQRVLPHRFELLTLRSVDEVCAAIRDMAVRGAGLIGAAAGCGMWLAARAAAGASGSDFAAAMRQAAERLTATRPTAGNLARAVRRQLGAMAGAASVPDKVAAVYLEAVGLMDEDAAFCRRIGQHGLALIRALYAAKRGRDSAARVEVLTHCNAGWLAFVDHGSALAPIYAAHDAGIPVHVWVDETRPRNQGASLTAFELGAHGVPHDLIADNAGGHLMQHGLADLVIVGADRVTRIGDAANKIGTYLKALAAWDNKVPFYVALPSSTFDFSLTDGVAEIPVEERAPDEVRTISGLDADGRVCAVRLCPAGTGARNWAFDVTPARLIRGLLTERGLCAATASGIARLFPEARAGQGAALPDNADSADGADAGRGLDGTPGACPGASPADGVVKFQAAHQDGPLPVEATEAALQLGIVRARLHDAGLIGVSPAGVGFGNLSLRLPCASGLCVISGTGTGAPRELEPSGFAVLEAALPAENRVISSGPARPSSEAMTHAAIYAARPDAHCVVHAHSTALFARLLAGDTPRTPPDVAYGTPAMAAAVLRLAQQQPAGLFVTPGHPEGIFAFGDSPEQVAERLLALLRQC